MGKSIIINRLITFVYRIVKFISFQNAAVVMHSFRNKPNEFDDLCDLYGTDKGGVVGSNRHGYSITYDLLFRSMRHKTINLFECGRIG